VIYNNKKMLLPQISKYHSTILANCYRLLPDWLLICPEYLPNLTILMQLLLKCRYNTYLSSTEIRMQICGREPNNTLVILPVA
jgi:hypothetical protein